MKTGSSASDATLGDARADPIQILATTLLNWTLLKAQPMSVAEIFSLTIVVSLAA